LGRIPPPVHELLTLDVLYSNTTADRAAGQGGDKWKNEKPARSYLGSPGQSPGGFLQPGSGTGISLGKVGSVISLPLLTSLSVFAVVAEKDNVVANNKKDMQNTFFMEIPLWFFLLRFNGTEGLR
jgi:hypothetical protein